MIRRLLCCLAVMLAVSGCSGVGNRGSTSGYVSGDGKITVVDVADREPAPELTGTDLDGKPLALADFAGKVVVVNVWGSWCPPCRAEAPALKEVAEQYPDVQFLGILTRDNAAAARAFNRKHGITYPTFADEGGRLELEFVDSLPSQAIPTTWVIDADGGVAARVVDQVTAATLAGLIDDVTESP